MSLGAGIACVAATALAGAGGAAPLIGWDILALVYGAWVWSTVWSLDPASAESDATRQDPSAPDYHDFAYPAFTIGITFQVSDTSIQFRHIRQTVLRHAWMSVPLVSVIIAMSINLVSSLAK